VDPSSQIFGDKCQQQKPAANFVNRHESKPKNGNAYFRIDSRLGFPGYLLSCCWPLLLLIAEPVENRSTLTLPCPAILGSHKSGTGMPKGGSCVRRQQQLSSDFELA
jgi:hypothetical protein